MEVVGGYCVTLEEDTPGPGLQRTDVADMSREFWVIIDNRCKYWAPLTCCEVRCCDYYCGGHPLEEETKEEALWVLSKIAGDKRKHCTVHRVSYIVHPEEVG